MATYVKNDGHYYLDAKNPADWPTDAREAHFGADWKNAPRYDETQHVVETTDDLDDDGDWNA